MKKQTTRKQKSKQDKAIQQDGVCRVCGCTDLNACGGGCYWVLPDLCSRCAFKAKGENIPVSQITVTRDGRTPEKDSDPAFKDLVASIARDGLLQPIGVTRTEEDASPEPGCFIEYTLVFGRRRLAAIMELGWPSIPAAVYPDCGASGAAVLSAVENLHRKNLNPVEEAVAVTILLEQIAGTKKYGPTMTRESSVSVPAAAIEAVASTLGKSVGWVRDRVILLRLAPKVRALLVAGRLTLGQAKELAKLADPQGQFNIAENLALESDRTGTVYSIADVRQHVHIAMALLRGCGWMFDVPFAGKRACVGCPHNTAVATALFADVMPADGKPAHCLDPGCFTHKVMAADQATNDLVKKAKKKPDVPATATGLATLDPPAGLKLAPAVRLLKKVRGEGPKPAAKKGRKGDGYVPYEKTPEGRFQKALSEWHAAVHDLVGNALIRVPLRLASMLVMVSTRGWQKAGSGWGTPSRSQRKKLDPLIKRAVAGTLDDLVVLAEDVTPESVERMGQIGHLWLCQHIAGLLEITLPPEPKRADFDPKPEPEPKAKAAKPKKKSGKGVAAEKEA